MRVLCYALSLGVLRLCNPQAAARQAPLLLGILKVRILESVAMPFSRGSSQPREIPRSPAMQADSLPPEPPGKPKNTGVGSISLFQGIFLTQESNQGLLHCRQMLYQLKGSLEICIHMIYSLCCTAETTSIKQLHSNFKKQTTKLTTFSNA